MCRFLYVPLGSKVLHRQILLAVAAKVYNIRHDATVVLFAPVLCATRSLAHIILHVKPRLITLVTVSIRSLCLSRASLPNLCTKFDVRHAMTIRVFG